jgi:hypothetical protein
MYKDNGPNWNAGGRKVVNYKNFLDNKDSEVENLKSKKRKFKKVDGVNKTNQDFVYNFNPITGKMEELTKSQIDDLISGWEERD